MQSKSLTEKKGMGLFEYLMIAFFVVYSILPSFGGMFPFTLVLMLALAYALAIALFESGLADLCDFNVTVVAPKEIRLERIMKRDNITEEKALERINAQKDESFFTSQSDFVLWNYPPYDINVEIRPIVAQIQL